MHLATTLFGDISATLGRLVGRGHAHQSAAATDQIGAALTPARQAHAVGDLAGSSYVPSSYVPLFPGRDSESGVQVGVEDLERAAVAWKEQLQAGNPDHRVIVDIAMITRRLADVADRTMPPYPTAADVPRIDEARRLLVGISRSLSDLQGQWAFEPEWTKHIPNLQRAVDRLGASVHSTNLRDWRIFGEVGQAKTEVAVAAQQLSGNSFTNFDRSIPVGTAGRAVGLARAAEDASLRVGAAISEVKNEHRFVGTAARMANIGVEQLRNVLIEGSDLVPPATAARLRASTDELTSVLTPSHPETITTTYMDFVRRAEGAVAGAREAAAELDEVLAKLPPHADPARVAMWRQLPDGAGADPWYGDIDFGLGHGAYRPVWPPVPLDARPAPRLVN